jgi:hypothetical protein
MKPKGIGMGLAMWISIGVCLAVVAVCMFAIVKFS